MGAKIDGFYNRIGKLLHLDDLIPYDGHIGGVVIVDHAHHEVHEGHAFTCRFTDTVMGDTDTIILAFKTMSVPIYIHMQTKFSTLVGGNLQIWEGATWTTNTGTVAPIICRNRGYGCARSKILEDKTATPAFTVTGNILSNVTGLNTGSATSLYNEYAFGIKGKIEAGERGVSEFVLKSDTKYAFVFTAIGASNKAAVTLDWYEHPEYIDV